MNKQIRSLQDEGKTVMMVVIEDRIKGLIAVADTIKPESADAIKELRNQGLKVVMLTGDNA